MIDDGRPPHSGKFRNACIIFRGPKIVGMKQIHHEFDDQKGKGVSQSYVFEENEPLEVVLLFQNK